MPLPDLVFPQLIIYCLSNYSKMECLKDVMSVLIDYLKPTIRQYAWMDQKRKDYELGEFVKRIQLMTTTMKTLVKHILQNFASNSYMERHAFVYQLNSKYGNFIPLIKESFTVNQHQKPTF